MDLVKFILSAFHAHPHLLKIRGAPQLRLPEHLGCMSDAGDSNLTVAGGDRVGEKKQQRCAFPWPCNRQMCFYRSAGCILHNKDALINDREGTV